MPAAVRDLVYDPATQLIHVLGTAPDGQGATVYVVEPHANAVFADARLPAEPIAWALDADADRPSQDREQLLAISADGAMSAVETGQNAFGWRFPGVILGALTAALLYLLARVLFRRREVAVAVAALVLVDGMTFAQSRIGMNDVYVGVFIVAAYLLFAMVWLGTWRGWSAMLVGLPLIGISLGLALAAKWVGLYAVGGIVLLILLRSALGRALALVAMIAMTGLFGWLAVSSPSSSTTGPAGLVAVPLLVAAGCAIGLRVAGRRLDDRGRRGRLCGHRDRGPAGHAWQRHLPGHHDRPHAPARGGHGPATRSDGRSTRRASRWRRRPCSASWERWRPSPAAHACRRRVR